MTIDRRDDEQEATLPVADTLPCFILTRGWAEQVAVLDASYRGLSATTRTPPALRSLVKLRLELPTGRLVVHAVVMRIVRRSASAVDLSLRFFMLNGDARVAWDAYINAVAKPLVVAA